MNEITEKKVKCISDVSKVQEIGKDLKGKSRYMIYITSAARRLNLTKGDKVVFSIYKIGHEEQKANNPESKKNFASTKVEISE